MGWTLALSGTAATICSSTSVPSFHKPASRYSPAVSWNVCGWSIMVEVSVFAAAGSFDASQFSAMDRTSSGSSLCAAVASSCRASLGRPVCRNTAAFRFCARMFSALESIERSTKPRAAVISPRAVAI